MTLTALIFDDEKDWTDIIGGILSPKFQVVKTSAVEGWKKEMSASFFDVIIVDVDIINFSQYGTQIAEDSILEHRITSPVIVVSGKPVLKKIKQEYGAIFLEYISKDDLNRTLLKSALDASNNVTQQVHIRNMLFAMAKRHDVLNDIVIPEFVQQYDSFRIFSESIDGKTIEDLIRSPVINGMDKYVQAGRIILDIIHNQRERPN